MAIVQTLAAAPIRLPAWELSYASSAATKRKKKVSSVWDIRDV